MVLIASFPLKSLGLLGLVVFLIFVQLLSMVESHVNLRGLSLSPNVDLVVEASSQVVFSPEVTSLEESLGVSFKALDFYDAPAKRELLNKRNMRRIILRELWFSFFGSLHSLEVDTSKSITVGKDPQILEISFKAPGRGVHSLPPVMALSFFPFGLFRALKIINFGSVSYFVYPKPKPSDLASRSVKDEVGSAVKMAAESRPVSGSEDYSHHRSFRQGDAVRRVDWRASSRRGIKMIKVFSAGQSPGVTVLSWYNTASSNSEEKLSELAFEVIQASKNNQTFVLELPSSKTKAGHGERHKKDCLRLLAAFEFSHEKLAERG